MKNQKLYKILLITTAGFIVIYWASVFTGVFPVEELVAGYGNWFMSFPVPDIYVAISASVAAYYLTSRAKLSGLFGAMAGSGLIFLGLYAFAYGHNTGLLYQLTVDEVIEICIKVYCLTAGIFFIHHSWKLISR